MRIDKKSKNLNTLETDANVQKVIQESETNIDIDTELQKPLIDEDDTEIQTITQEQKIKQQIKQQQQTSPPQPSQPSQQQPQQQQQQQVDEFSLRQVSDKVKKEEYFEDDSADMFESFKQKNNQQQQSPQQTTNEESKAKRVYSAFNVDAIVNFGKYKGLTWKKALQDPKIESYLEYLISKATQAYLKQTCIDALKYYKSINKTNN